MRVLSGPRVEGSCMNRDWQLWCLLSGSDPGNGTLKMRFNTDPRVAAISRLPGELAESLAREVWREHTGCEQEAFLALWFAAAEESQRPQRQEAERQRRAQAAALERQRVQLMERQRDEELARRHAASEARRSKLAGEERRRAEAVARVAAMRDRIGCLYNITPIANLRSIVQRGILSHNLAASLPHEDVSNADVQNLRWGRKAANGTRLHDFASLYFNPHNAMLYTLALDRRDLVVLRISRDVLSLRGVHVTDGNAANRSSRSWLLAAESPDLPFDRIYARYWTGADGRSDDDLKRTTQAEVLVPNTVPPEFVESFIVRDQSAYRWVRQLAPDLPGSVDPDLFFSSP